MTVCSVAFAGSNQTRVLENDLVSISLRKAERLEAEPVSKPYEIVMETKCKKNKSKAIQKQTLPVCDFDLQDKETKINKTTLSIAHFAWDAAKSSNNPDGRNYCDAKQKIFHEIKIEDLCNSNQKK